MKRLILAAGLLTMALPAAAVYADAPAAVYSTSSTDLGTLLDHSATKAVLQKYIPTLIANPQIDMARGMTLKQAQSFAADQLTDATLAKIDADLAKIPVTK